MRAGALANRRLQIWPYVQIARVDHWFKNAFMLLGVMLALFYSPDRLTWRSMASLLLALAATCLIASSNYVLNELLDGPRDRLHPRKRERPVPSGRVRADIGYVEWLVLAAAGIGLAFAVNLPFAFTGIGLWTMGLVYNAPPIRTKEWPYLDVLSEAVNNPIRLFLGWFAIVIDRVPPLSLAIAYWMAGAFFMVAKRLAEYRHIGDPAIAAAYRKSFAHYTEERLLTSLLFYSTACALFTGVFIVRYHVELVLFAPVAAALFAYYFKITLRPNSPMQYPEKLYKEDRFLVYTVGGVLIFVALMFANIPILYDWFNISPSGLDRLEPLWTIGGGR